MRLVPTLLLSALALGIGCSDDPTPPRDVSLSIKVGPPGAAAGVARLALNLPDGIDLDRVRLILKEVELENEDGHHSGDDGLDDNGDDNTDGGTDEGVDDNGGGTDDGVDDNDGGTDDGLDDNGDDNTDGSTDESGELEIEFGPFLVDLDRAALAGDIVEHLVSATVPQGTYEKLKFKIDRIDARAGDPAALADLTRERLSVLIEGTIDGEPFTFKSGLEAEQELRVNIVVGDGGSEENLTLFLNADTWFVDASTGERLDPRDAGDALEIAANIRGSIHAEDDDDHDGIGDNDDEDDDRSGPNPGHEGEDENDDDEDRDGGVDDEDDGGNSGPG
jgi:hypothetical protein